MSDLVTQMMCDAMDEVVRLRAEIQALRSAPCESCRERDQQIQALDAENERLREALAHCQEQAGTESCSGYALEIERLRETMRQSLQVSCTAECMAAAREGR